MTINPRLPRLIALYDRCEAEWERFDREVELPAKQAYAAAVAALPTETPPPHEQVATMFINMDGDTMRLSTANVYTLPAARKIAAGHPEWVDMGDEEWRQAHRELAAAADARDAIVAEQTARRKAAEQELRARFRIDAIERRSSELADRRFRAWKAALDTPAAGMADMVAKLDFLDRGEISEEDERDAYAALRADIRNVAEVA